MVSGYSALPDMYISAPGSTAGLTMATFDPTSALTSVDLPAFGAPMMAAKPQR